MHNAIKHNVENSQNLDQDFHDKVLKHAAENKSYSKYSNISHHATLTWQIPVE